MSVDFGCSFSFMSFRCFSVFDMASSNTALLSGRPSMVSPISDPSSVPSSASAASVASRVCLVVSWPVVPPAPWKKKQFLRFRKM